MLAEAAQYQGYPLEKGKYPGGVPCGYDPSLPPGSQFPPDPDRTNYPENEYAYVWDNNAAPPGSGSVNNKSRMPGGSKEGALYEPTNVRKTGQGDHGNPQYYDTDPELMMQMSGVPVSVLSVYPRQPGIPLSESQSDRSVEQGPSTPEFLSQDRVHKLNSMIERN